VTLDELKALIAMGQDCGEAEMKALWPEILKLVEAVEANDHMWEMPYEIQGALADFNKKLASL